MSTLFEEIDYCPTPIGPISLRRRRVLSLDQDVYEVILGDEHLMSSLFTASEIALSKLGLAALEGSSLDVVVGGLGMGYTAAAALEDERVASLQIIEFLEPIIEWHRDNLMPLDPPLSADGRCSIRQGDFFELVRTENGFDANQPKRKYDAILVDIDHTPDWLLDERSQSFYHVEGLREIAGHLKPGGVFGLWSDTTEDKNVTDRLAQVFDKNWVEPVAFPNPYLGDTFTQCVYLACKK